MGDAWLDRAFVALGDPVRRAIVARLSRGPATVGELAEPFAITMQAVSRHIRVLEEAGLVTRSRDAQRRPVHLDAAALEQLTAWIDRYRLDAERAYRRLDSVLAATTAAPTASPRVTPAASTPATPTAAVPTAAMRAAPAPNPAAPAGSAHTPDPTAAATTAAPTGPTPGPTAPAPTAAVPTDTPAPAARASRTAAVAASGTIPRTPRRTGTKEKES